VTGYYSLTSPKCALNVDGLCAQFIKIGTIILSNHIFQLLSVNSIIHALNYPDAHLFRDIRLIVRFDSKKAYKHQVKVAATMIGLVAELSFSLQTSSIRCCLRSFLKDEITRHTSYRVTTSLTFEKKVIIHPWPLSFPSTTFSTSFSLSSIAFLFYSFVVE
jgi:hypothetical protein